MQDSTLRPAAKVATGGLKTMVLTRSFKETIQARMELDPTFREELLKEGVECLLSGDMDTGKAVLRGLQWNPAERGLTGDRLLQC